MKLLIISYQLNESGSVASKRCISLANSFSEAGHEVTVMSCKELSNRFESTKFKQILISNKAFKLLTKLFQDNPKQDSPANNSCNKNISWLKQLFSLFNKFRANKGIFFLGRSPDISYFWKLSAWSKLKSAGHWDLIISSYAPFSTLELAVKAKSAGITNAICLDFRDPWSKHHLFEGLPLFRILESYKEKKLISSADLVTTATDGVKNRLTIRPKRQITIYNGFDAAVTSNLTAAKPDNNQDFTFIHTGSLYLHRQKIDSFFTAYMQLQKEFQNTNVLFIGNEKPYIDHLISTHQLEQRIKHLGTVSNKTCNDLIGNSHCAISFDINDEAFDGIVPTKLSDYVAHKKAIIQIVKRQNSEAVQFLKGYPAQYLANYSTESIYKVLKTALEQQQNDHLKLKKFNNEEYSRVNRNKILIQYFGTSSVK